LSNVFRTAHRLGILLCHSVTKTSSASSGGKKGGKGKLNLVGPFGTVSILTLDIIWQKKKGSFSGGYSVLCLATDVQGKQKAIRVQTTQAHGGVEV